MSADRRSKVAALIGEQVATFIRHESNTDPMITLTNVDLSPDMKYAIIFVTTIPENREQDAIVFLKRNGSEIRKHLKKQLKLKVIPHLDFMIDAGERHRQHMDEIVREVEGRPARTLK